MVIASRKHSGTYVLKAENSSGKDEATIQINVLDVPAKPEGPLKVRYKKIGCLGKLLKKKSNASFEPKAYEVCKLRVVWLILE